MKRIGSTRQRLQQKPYEQRICRSENYPDCINAEPDGTGMTLDEYVQFIEEVGLEVQTFYAQGPDQRPRFDSKLIRRHPGSTAADPLPAFIEKAHERGILCLTYYPMNCSKPLAELHPEWMMRFLDDGRAQPVNDEWPCFNSPFRDWVCDYLCEFVEHLDVDGFYFDDMNWGSHGPHVYFPSCRCIYCQALYDREAGATIPEKIDFSSIDFRRFLIWRYDKMRQFMNHVVRRVRETYPHAILDFNYYGGVYGNWNMGHPINPLNLRESGGYFFIENTIYDSASLSAKLGRAHGSPCGVWIGPSHFMPECNTHMVADPEIYTPAIRSFGALANGACPQMAMLDGPIQFRRKMYRDLFAQLKQRAPYMAGETVKYVAMHWSQQTRDLHHPVNDPFVAAAEYYRRIRGTYEILNQSHVLADVVLDEQLSFDHLSKYPVLLLSDSACLSDVHCQSIARFVEAGGVLLATCRTSLLDHLGQARQDFGLSEVLGVSYRGTIEDGQRIAAIYEPQSQQIESVVNPVLCFAARQAEIVCRPGSKVEVLATRSNLSGNRPLDRYRPEMKIGNDRPAVTVHGYGKGKAIYVNADVGDAYTHNPYVPLRRFVSHLIRAAARPQVDVIAPASIEMSAVMRKSAEQLLIHLTNNPISYFAHSGSPEVAKLVQTYFYNLGDVAPVHDIEIALHGFKPNSARLPLSKTSLDLKHQGGRSTTIRVPRVHLHEVVEVSLELNAASA